MTRPKQFGPEQNNLYTYKTIWTVQNLFGPIEGQGVRGEIQYTLESGIEVGPTVINLTFFSRPYGLIRDYIKVI